MRNSKICFCRLFLMFTLFLSLTGCQSSNILNQEEMEEGKFSVYSNEFIDELYNNRFTVHSPIYSDEFSVKELAGITGKRIGAILCKENSIIITDRENGKLIVLNKEGDVIREIGTKGNGKLEFLDPTGIAGDDNHIYVLDSGNRRIQILDEYYDYLDEITLPKNNENDLIFFNSIAIDDEGNIFMASIEFRSAYILCYERISGEFKKISQNFCGTISDCDGKVYAINVGLVTGKSEKDISGIRTGINYLYHVTASGLESICELPYGITVTGFEIFQDEIICASGTYRSVDAYSLNGEYIYSLAELEEMDFFSNLSIAHDGSIYVGLDTVRKLYHVKPEKETLK